jgi:hypothetical protein
MGMPVWMPVSVTLGSSGIGRAVDRNWISSKFAAHPVAFSSSGIAAWTVEGTLDDLQWVSSPVWFTLSSGNANSSCSLVRPGSNFYCIFNALPFICSHSVRRFSTRF